LTGRLGMISLVLQISFTRIGSVVVVLFLMWGCTASYKLWSAGAKYWRLNTESEFFESLNKKLTGKLEMIGLVLRMSFMAIS
jgi:hypothetical protein